MIRDDKGYIHQLEARPRHIINAVWGPRDILLCFGRSSRFQLPSGGEDINFSNHADTFQPFAGHLHICLPAYKIRVTTNENHPMTDDQIEDRHLSQLQSYTTTHILYVQRTGPILPSKVDT